MQLSEAHSRIAGHRECGSESQMQDRCRVLSSRGQGLPPGVSAGELGADPLREFLLLAGGDGGDVGWSEPSWAGPAECDLQSRANMASILEASSHQLRQDHVVDDEHFPDAPEDAASGQTCLLRAVRLNEPEGDHMKPDLVTNADTEGRCETHVWTASMSPLRCGGGSTGLEGLMEGIMQQLMPMITQLIQKAIAEAMGRGLGNESVQSPTKGEAKGEPRAKLQRGGDKSNTRKTPEEPGTTPNVNDVPRAPGPRGKGKGGTPQVPKREVSISENEGGWTKVSRKEPERFELRGQDWDCPLVAHSSIGVKLDELQDGQTLEAVVLAPKQDLQKVSTILRGTSKPYRVMLVELNEDGKQRVPGRLGNTLTFRQANVDTLFLSGKEAPRYAGTIATAVKVAPIDTVVITIRVPAIFCAAR